MNTLLLVNNAWDVCLDAGGNIAMAAIPYARAQDVASALRLFAAELWYDTSKGIPYFEEILGRAPPASTFEQYMVRAALTVPGVVSAQCTIDSVEARRLVGQVTFTSVDGTTDTVQLGDL